MLTKFQGTNYVYEGKLRNNKLHGYGILKDSKHIIYEGNFKEGKMNGEGVYAGPPILKNIIYNFPFFQNRNSSVEYRVEGNFKNNKPDGDFIKIFTNWGDFFYGSFRNGNINKGSFGGGWKIEHEGFNIAYLQWSKSENSFRRLKSRSNFIPQISKYIQSYEYHFNKYKWFPSKICINETDFIKTLKNWKKNSKKIAETALDTYHNHEMHLGEYENV